MSNENQEISAEEARSKTDSEKLIALADWFDLKYNEANGEVQQDLRRIAAQLNTQHNEQFESICACKVSDSPCSPHCSCKNPFMSGGCLNCATYGSPEQRKSMAEDIQKRLSQPTEEQETIIWLVKGVDSGITFAAFTSEESAEKYQGMANKTFITKIIALP